MTTIRIPSSMRALTDGEPTVQVEGATVREALAALVERFPSVESRLFDDAGKVRRFVNLFVGEEDVRFAQGLDTAVPAGATLSILPAVAGG